VSLQPEPNKLLIQQRLNWLSVIVVLAFLTLGARLWQLQIIQGSELALRAERNRVRSIQVVAPRGTISDRHNTPLVENRPAFNILLYRESVKDLETTSRFIEEKLHVSPDDLVARLRRHKGTGLYRPVVIKEDVGIEDISIVEAYKRDHPEIQLGPEPRRLYRYGSLAAHVLGYVGEVSDEELSRETFSNAKAGDLVGKSGVERFYNQCLTGIDGKRQVLVDSIGREVGLLSEEDSIVGDELQLTLDLDLQLAAENLLEDKVGTIIAMDPRNGEILAMASAPWFDPNSFSTRISEQEWNLLINDPNRPLQNRAIQNSYSPGSTFKLVMALAGLSEALVDEDTRVYCRGSLFLYNRVFHCSVHEGHGAVDLETAISRSCNVFFYELGRKMGISKIARHAHSLGLGERSGIDLPGERSGLIPTPEWKQQIRRSKWFAGETISVSIGQGAVTITPLQLVRAASAIASGGLLTTPHLFFRAERLTPEMPLSRVSHQLAIAPEASNRIRQGMWSSVNRWGTGHNAAIAGLDICGKTGTVQVIGNEKRKELQKEGPQFEDHSWFVGFATRDAPEIAVVVFLEHGGKGGIAAAPLAREIFRAYFERKQELNAGAPAPRLIAEARR